MFARLLWLSLGTFLIGTESFIVAGVLPELSGDLHVPVGAAGQLVTVYALSYAIGSPILATLLGNVSRKPLLIAALATFALANALAAFAPSLGALMAVRVLLGLSAGVFTPTANAVAVQLVPAEMRGRAIATVIGGMTVAVAFGAPLGTFLAGVASWRAPFAVLAGASVIAAAGLTIDLPRRLPAGAASLAERIAMASRPQVLVALLTTLFWAMSTFVLFVYVAPFLARAGIAGWQVSIALLVFGVGGAAGNIYGGVIADRIGGTRSVAASLTALGVVLALISAAATTLPLPLAGTVVVVLILPWGFAGWSFYPAQSSRLIAVGGEAPVVALSLNASALFFGQAAGAALGSLAISVGSLADLGFIGATMAFVALAILGLSLRPARRVAAPCPEPAE